MHASISVVIPVYQGEHTLEPLLAEIAALASLGRTPGGHVFNLAEVILVHDGARDHSAAVMQRLAERYPFVRTIWLSRNFGQHPATLAGMAGTSGEWVVTMDEDGQQRPEDIALLLDMALQSGAQLVYGNPRNAPPHGMLRNSLSAVAKWVFISVLKNRHIGNFGSFRLVEGEIARSLAAYCGPGVFLDVALSWVIAEAAHCPVTVRPERCHRSGYSLRSLFGHFWRLLLTSGTKPLRFIAFLGLLSWLLAIFLAAYAVWAKFTSHVPIAGWTSTTMINCFFFGGILLALGIVAEYLAVAVAIVLGKPLYLVTSRPPGKHESRKSP